MIIRSEPRGVPRRFSSFVPTVLWRHLRRRLRRDRAWTLVVREYDADPFGPILHREDVPTKADVPAAVDRLATQLKRGTVPPTPTAQP